MWQSAHIEISGVMGPYPAQVRVPRPSAGLLARFDEPTARRMAADAQVVRRAVLAHGGSADEAYEVLFDGVRMLVRDYAERDTERGNDYVEQCGGPDRRGYYTLPGACWELVPEPWPQRAAVLERLAGDRLAALLAGARRQAVMARVAAEQAERAWVLACASLAEAATEAWELRVAELGVPAGHLQAVTTGLYLELAGRVGDADRAQCAEPEHAVAPGTRQLAGDELLGAILYAGFRMAEAPPHALAPLLDAAAGLLERAFHLALETRAVAGGRIEAVRAAVIEHLVAQRALTVHAVIHPVRLAEQPDLARAPVGWRLASPAVLQALERVLAYSMPDEVDDFAEHAEDGEAHILTDMQTLDDWRAGTGTVTFGQIPGPGQRP